MNTLRANNNIIASLITHAACIQAVTYLRSTKAALEATVLAVFLHTISQEIVFPLEEKIIDGESSLIGRVIILEVLNGLVSSVAALATGAVCNLSAQETWSVGIGCFVYTTGFVVLRHIFFDNPSSPS